MREAKRHVSLLGEQAMEIKYENLLSEPMPVLCSLTKFINISQSEKNLQKVMKYIKPERVYAYRKNPELYLFADKVAEKLKKFGY